MKNSSIKIHPISSDQEPLKKEVGQLSVDIFQTQEHIVILAPIAGIKEKDIKISITDDVLVIKGERKVRHNIEDEKYYTRECFWGPFSRSIVLPLEADVSKVTANFEDNVLEIEIPKKELKKTKIIKIQSNK